MADWKLQALFILLLVAGARNVLGQITYPDSNSTSIAESMQNCDCSCSGRPSWGVFAGAVIGSSFLALLIGFACLSWFVGRATEKIESPTDKRETAMEARMRGLGSGGAGYMAANHIAVELDQFEPASGGDDGSGHGGGGVAPSSDATHGPDGQRNPKTSVQTRKISHNNPPGSPASTPGERRLAAIGRSAAGDSDSSRPSSAVGTPGAGRVGFSKERKDARKAYLGSSEFLNVTPKGSPTTPRSRTTSQANRISRLVSESSTQSPSAVSQSVLDADENAAKHIVVANPQSHSSRRTSDISISDISMSLSMKSQDLAPYDVVAVGATSPAQTTSAHPDSEPAHGKPSNAYVTVPTMVVGGQPSPGLVPSDGQPPQPSQPPPPASAPPLQQQESFFQAYDSPSGYEEFAEEQASAVALDSPADPRYDSIADAATRHPSHPVGAGNHTYSSVDRAVATGDEVPSPEPVYDEALAPISASLVAIRPAELNIF